MTLLSGMWPMVLLGLTTVCSVVFGLFKHQQAKTAQATASAQVAEMQSKIDNANAAVAAEQTSAVETREQADAAAQALPAEDLNSELDKLGALRKD